MDIELIKDLFKNLTNRGLLNLLKNKESILLDYADYIDFSILTSEDWCSLLTTNIQWIKYCHLSMVENHYKVSIFSKHPELFQESLCKEFSGYDWSVLLKHQPQFSKYCDWSKLTSNPWSELLEHQPQFMDDYLNTVSSLGDNGNKDVCMDLRQWARLLTHQPQFIIYTNIRLFESNELSIIIKSKNKELIKHVDDNNLWDKLVYEDVEDILKENPDLVNKLPVHKLSDYQLLEIIKLHPHLVETLLQCVPLPSKTDPFWNKLCYILIKQQEGTK